MCFTYKNAVVDALMMGSTLAITAKITDARAKGYEGLDGRKGSDFNREISFSLDLAGGLKSSGIPIVSDSNKGSSNYQLFDAGFNKGDNEIWVASNYHITRIDLTEHPEVVAKMIEAGVEVPESLAELMIA